MRCCAGVDEQRSAAASAAAGGAPAAPTRRSRRCAACAPACPSATRERTVSLERGGEELLLHHRAASRPPRWSATPSRTTRLRRRGRGRRRSGGRGRCRRRRAPVSGRRRRRPRARAPSWRSCRCGLRPRCPGRRSGRRPADWWRTACSARPARAATRTPASCARSTSGGGGAPSALATSRMGWAKATSSRPPTASMDDAHPRPRLVGVVGQRRDVVAAQDVVDEVLLLGRQQLADGVAVEPRRRRRRRAPLGAAGRPRRAGRSTCSSIQVEVDFEPLRGCGRRHRARRTRRRW